MINQSAAWGLTLQRQSLISFCCALTLIRLGYFGGWKDWGGWPPLEISAVDRAIAAKIPQW